MENEKNQTIVESTEQKKKKKSKKKLMIIAIIALLIIVIFASSGSSDPTVEPIDSDSTSSSQSATSEIKAGSSVSNDELKISYKSCNPDFKNYSKYADIKSGYKVIEATFDFENISTTDIILEGFECYADGVKCEEFYSVDDYFSPVLESVSAGRKLANCAVYYEVPKNTEIIELEYEADYWSGEKYIFIVE